MFRGRCRFFRLFFVPLPFSLCMESTSYVCSSSCMVFLYLVITGSIFYISLSENSIIQPKHLFHLTTAHHLAFSRFTATLNQGLPLLFIKFSIRIGCQPEKNTFLHGGQSCSWSAEQENEIKQRKSGSVAPRPRPRAAGLDKIK